MLAVSNNQNMEWFFILRQVLFVGNKPIYLLCSKFCVLKVSIDLQNIISHWKLQMQ